MRSGAAASEWYVRLHSNPLSTGHIDSNDPWLNAVTATCPGKM